MTTRPPQSNLPGAPDDWHVTGPLWSNYLLGALGPSAAAAVETHVEHCSTCQVEIAGGGDAGPVAADYAASAASISGIATAAGSAARAVPTAQTAPTAGATWAAVHARISVSKLRWPISALRKLGLGSEDAAILSASDSMRLPWAVAVGGAIACVIVSGSLGGWRDVSFLLLGPLIPVLAVLAAFDATDPLRELAAATPLPKLRVGLLRAVATLVVAIPSMAGLTALVPVLQENLWTWLLPSLGLTCAALFALRWLRPWHAAAVVGVAWSVLVLGANAAGDLYRLGSAAGQLAFAGVQSLRPPGT